MYSFQSEKFLILQALGNIYFIHQTLNTVKIWNFLTHEWENAEGKCIYTGNIETIATKEKAKFPQHFFPEVCIYFVVYPFTVLDDLFTKHDVFI